METAEERCLRLEARVAELEAEKTSLTSELRSQQEEFQEFEENSRQLETELERQCESLERSKAELSSRLAAMEAARERGDQGAQEHRRQMSRLERELEAAQTERDELRKTIRELEQANDDLERAKRNALTSLEDLERGMNDMIERNALLENELEEGESVKVQYQRLRDEARELKEELKVQEKRRTESNPSSSLRAPRPIRTSAIRPAPASDEPMDTSGPVNAHSEQQQQRPTGIPRSMTLDSPGGPLTPGGRVTALNIVGDLLRKVGALESRLQSARMKCPAPSPPDEGSPRGPQAKQLHLSQPTSPPSRLPLPKTSPPKLKQ